GVPVVWVQHSDEHLARGSDAWRIVPELSPGGTEPLVEKSYGDSFENTPLETVLSDLGVGRLVVVGAQTDASIRSTPHGAVPRGYPATLVTDAPPRAGRAPRATTPLGSATPTPPRTTPPGEPPPPPPPSPTPTPTGPTTR